MRNLLNDFYQLFLTNEAFQEQANKYERAMKTDDWKFLRDTILVIRSNMLSDMLSSKHTKLSAQEKDVIQQTYYNLHQILDFILDPFTWGQKKSIRHKSLTNLGKSNQPQGKE